MKKKSDDKNVTIGCFSVDPDFAVDLARDLYWKDQNNRLEAINILRCFVGITDEQIEQVLSGDATITKDFKFTNIRDFVWKEKLKKIKEENDEIYYKIGGRRVHKYALDEYCDHVKNIRSKINRVLDTKSLEDYMLSPDPMQDFEEILQDLHNKVIADAGFDPAIRDSCEWTKDFYTFTCALDEYINEKAGTGGGKK